MTWNMSEMGFPKMGDAHLMKMDDLGVPLFQETSK